MGWQEELEARMKEMENLPPATPNPCNECPWLRDSNPGHLGPYSAEYWATIAHGNSPVACHKTIKRTDDDGEGDWADPAMRQCAGMAQFRTNICKKPLFPQVATAEERDTSVVFAWDDEFIAHHNGED
jgi:hypothetical protein